MSQEKLMEILNNTIQVSYVKDYKDELLYIQLTPYALELVITQVVEKLAKDKENRPGCCGGICK